MQLQEINKTIYRQRLNRIIIGFIASFACLSLVFGATFIAMFSTPDTVVLNDEQTSNFKYNLAGVIVALMVTGAILQRLRNTEFFYEVYYVWRLKQVQNKIYRKLSSIKKEAYSNTGIDALIVLNYYYLSLKQIYRLDDNTITMSSLNADHQKVIDFAEKRQVDLDKTTFEKEMLTQF